MQETTTWPSYDCQVRTFFVHFFSLLALLAWTGAAAAAWIWWHRQHQISELEAAAIVIMGLLAALWLGDISRDLRRRRDLKEGHPPQSPIN